jgi:hypothetical protein
MRTNLASLGAGAFAAVAALSAASGAHAKDKEDHARAAAFQSVLDCRSIKDNAARLACYDAAAASMDQAESRGDIVVIDRAQAEAAHRESFGLSLPSLSFVTKALKPDEVNRVEGTVRTAKADVNGKWTISLADGAVWRQVSGDLQRPPKAGSKVEIRKGSIGSYLMNVDGQQSIKVHRDQ